MEPHTRVLPSPFGSLVRIYRLGRLLWHTSPLTLRFNFHYFPTRVAVRLPVLLHRGIRLRALRGTVKLEGPVHRGMVAIGYRQTGIFDEKASRTVWDNSGTVIFRGSASFGAGCQVSVGSEACLTVGDNLTVTAHATFICRHSIVIGDDCLISWEALIMDSDLHQILGDTGGLMNPNRPIHIGNRAWIGCRSVVLKGSNLADDMIVAANSTVSGCPAGSGTVVGGPAARVLREGVHWSTEPVPSGRLEEEGSPAAT